MWRWFSGDARLSKRVSTLEEELPTLRRELKEAVLEAEQLYEQTRRTLGRISKRAPDAAPVAPEASPDPAPAPRANGPDPVSARILSFRHARRARPGGA